MGDIADQFRASTRVEALTRVTTVADAETLLARWASPSG